MFEMVKTYAEYYLRRALRPFPLSEERGEGLVNWTLVVALSVLVLLGLALGVMTLTQDRGNTGYQWMNTNLPSSAFSP